MKVLVPRPNVLDPNPAKDQPSIFIPRAFGGVGYNQDQLEEIEQLLAYYELELRPLDGNMGG